MTKAQKTFEKIASTRFAREALKKLKSMSDGELLRPTSREFEGRVGVHKALRDRTHYPNHDSLPILGTSRIMSPKTKSDILKKYPKADDYAIKHVHKPQIALDYLRRRATGVAQKLDKSRPKLNVLDIPAEELVETQLNRHLLGASGGGRMPQLFDDTIRDTLNSMKNK